MIDEHPQISFSTAALTGAAVTLFLMGLIAAAYGPLILFLTGRFHVSLAGAGAVFGAQFGGGLLGVVAAILLMERISGRVGLTAGLMILGLGAVGVAVAATWPLLLGAVFVIGIGFGALDFNVNQLLAHSVDSRRVAQLNYLNGLYGLGAVAGPLLVSGLGASYPALYGAGAVVAAVTIVAWRGVAGKLTTSPSAAPLESGQNTGLVAVFVVAFILYVGTEVGIGGWMPTHLHSLRYSAAAAATLTSGFWLALAAGRFIVAPLTSRLSDHVIVLAGMAAAVVALGIAMIPNVAPAGYILAGLAMAPIFPTGLAWLARLARNPRATSWVFPAAMVGGAVVPTGVGVAIATVGPSWVPAILALVAMASLIAFAAGRLIRGSAPD